MGKNKKKLCYSLLLSDTSFPEATICNPPHHTKSGRSIARYIEYEYAHSTASGSLQVVPQSWQSRSGQCRLSFAYTTVLWKITHRPATVTRRPALRENA